MEKTDLPDHLFGEGPRIHERAFIAHGAVVVGDVTLKEDASVWYNAVLRGDINRIEIGERSNVQDGAVIHLENELGCSVGDDVTIGHKAILHGCTIHNKALIGMGAIVLNGAVIGEGAVVGAGAVVKEGMQVEPYSLVVGIPAKVVKTLDDSTGDVHCRWAQKYVALARAHREKASRYRVDRGVG